MKVANRRRPAQIGPKSDRGAFWDYCRRTTAQALYRSVARGLPYQIDAHFVDGLLVDQRWLCAISGVELRPPIGKTDPFGPSLDRIVPELGYVPGNVRIVCNMVNFAMNAWGLDNLLILIEAMKRKAP